MVKALVQIPDDLYYGVTHFATANDKDFREMGFTQVLLRGKRPLDSDLELVRK